MTVLYLTWAAAMFATALFGVVTKPVAGDDWSAFVAEGSIAALIVIWFTVMQRLVPSSSSAGSRVSTG